MEVILKYIFDMIANDSNNPKLVRKPRAHPPQGRQYPPPCTKRILDLDKPSHTLILVGCLNPCLNPNDCDLRKLTTLTLKNSKYVYLKVQILKA